MAPPRRRVINMMIGYTVAAFLVTSFRLAIRKIRNWGKDDLLAVMATLGLMAQATVMALKDRGSHIATGSPGKLANVYYANNFLFYGQDWWARLSILFSILRICPTPRMAMFLKIMAVLFFLTWVTLESLLFGLCKKDEYEWSRRAFAGCALDKSIIYLQFAVALVSDIVLVVVPWRILTLLPGLKGLVFRLRVLFSSTLLLTAVTAVQTAITLSGAGKAGTNGLVAATTETFVAILVCNATALAGAFVILFGRDAARKPVHDTVTAVGTKGDSDSTSSEKHGSGHAETDTVGGNTLSFAERWKQLDIDADLEKEMQSTTASRV